MSKKSELWKNVALATTVFVLGAVAFGLTVTTYDEDNALVAKSAATGRKARLARGAGLKLVPLRWDKDEGAFMISLYVGAGEEPVEFVLDSGSGSLSAKGPGCKWTSCGESGQDVCTTQACPCRADKTGKKCNASRYVPQGRKLRPGESGAGKETTVAFGSQEDTVTHFMEDVHMPHATAESCQAALNGGTLRADAKHLMSNVVVHQVHAIKGTSTSNIMGLSLPAPGNTQVVVSRLTDVWSLVLFDTKGWFALQSMQSCFPNTQFMKLVWPREFSSFMTRFYVVPLKKLEVVNGNSAVTVGNCPQFVVFDTGTTCCYTEPTLGAHMRQTCSYSPQSSGLVFTLKGESGDVLLDYSASELRDPDNPSLSSFNCEPDTTLPDYHDIFGNTSVVLFGAVPMRNRYWEYDLSKKRLGVHKL